MSREPQEADLEDWIAFGEHEAPPSAPKLDIVGWIVIALAVVVLLGVVLLRPTGEAERRLAASEFVQQFGFVSEFHPAEVAAVDVLPCEFDPQTTCQVVTFTLLAGPNEGETREQTFPQEGATVGFRVGTEEILARVPDAPEGFDYQFSDRQRRPVLLWVLLAFATAVTLLGGVRGIAALAGLGGSVAVMLLFVLPAILDGRDPTAVALIGAAAIAYLALYLAHGFSRKTNVALLGTLSALALTALLSWVVVDAARLTGLTGEETLFLVGLEGVDLRGLVLAGIVLGAAGALDDVTVTQASAVWELKARNAQLKMSELMRSGLRIGRDHIASTVNTLFLAYAGAALPLLVLLILTDQSLGTAANSEVIATEIIRTLVGSIGLVAAVPFTTWLAAWTVAPAPTKQPHSTAPEV